MGRSYRHLSLEERRKIAKWREAKMPVPEVADQLGRAASTIYRELKRNFFDDKELPELNGYHAVAAQEMYEQRHAVHRKVIVHPELKEAVEDRLKAGWSDITSSRSRVRRFANGWSRMGFGCLANNGSNSTNRACAGSATVS